MRDGTLLLFTYVNQTEEVQNINTFDYVIVDNSFAYIEHWSYEFEGEYYDFRAVYHINSSGNLLETYWIRKSGEDYFSLISNCNVYS